MSEATGFREYINGERVRLNQKREEIVDHIGRCQNSLAAVDTELAAIQTYEAAKSGKVAAVAREPLPRAPRSSRRQAILQVLAEEQHGMKRGEILDALGVKGDKHGEMSVSNALTVLIGAGQLVREGGRYSLPAPELREAAE